MMLMPCPKLDEVVRRHRVQGRALVVDHSWLMSMSRRSICRRIKFS